jgi:heme/copper-type cytochrome/quinol oxidase subunit 4
MKNFLQNTKFFFTDFHTWTINIFLHVISLWVFIAGILEKNIVLFVIWFAVIDELGHIYNFYFLHKRDARYNPARMIPYQVIFTLPPALVLFYLFLM